MHRSARRITDRRYAGLFGVIDGGSVRNLTVLEKYFMDMEAMTVTEETTSFTPEAAA